jgi:hypothetical protein
MRELAQACVVEATATGVKFQLLAIHEDLLDVMWAADAYGIGNVASDLPVARRYGDEGPYLSKRRLR